MAFRVLLKNWKVPPHWASSQSCHCRCVRPLVSGDFLPPCIAVTFGVLVEGTGSGVQHLDLNPADHVAQLADPKQVAEPPDVSSLPGSSGVISTRDCAQSMVHALPALLAMMVAALCPGPGVGHTQTQDTP